MPLEVTESYFSLEGSWYLVVLSLRNPLATQGHPLRAFQAVVEWTLEMSRRRPRGQGGHPASRHPVSCYKTNEPECAGAESGPLQTRIRSCIHPVEAR